MDIEIYKQQSYVKREAMQQHCPTRAVPWWPVARGGAVRRAVSTPISAPSSCSRRPAAPPWPSTYIRANEGETK